MVKLVLLFRMISFTVLFISLSLGILAYQKSPRRWLRVFLIYMGVEAVYSVSFTFVFYSNVYLSDQPTAPSAFFILFQIITSAAILYIAPRFLLELTGTLRKPAHVRSHLALLVLPFALTIFTLCAQLPETFQGLAAFYAQHARLISASFYLYIAAFLLFSLLRRKQMPTGRWHREILIFVSGATLFHVMWVVDVGFLDFTLEQEGPLRGILLTNALYEIFWAVIIAIPSIAEINGRGTAAKAVTVPQEFIREYSLSAREQEVLPLLCDGMSSKDIAEALFISPRTVENHIHSMYRKCGVKRRLELVNLVSRY